MTWIIWKLTENPNKEQIKEVQKKAEKDIIIDNTKKDITSEEFEQMSWKDLEKNIKVDPNGSLTLFGKTISYWLHNSIWSDEQLIWLNKFEKEFLENQKNLLERVKKQNNKISLIKNILKIWIPEAQKQAYWVWFTSFGRDDKKIILNDVAEITNKIQSFWVPISDEIFNDEANWIFNLMQDAESEEDIIWEDDLKKIKNIFFDENINPEDKEIKILNLMRYWGLSWNSEEVKEIVANKLLKTETFKKESEILKNPKLKEYLEDKNIIKLKDFLGWDEEWIELSEKLLEVYEKTEESLDKKLKNSLWKINEERKNKWEKELNFEEYKKLKEKEIKSETLNATLKTFKHILIYNHINKDDYRGTEDTLKWMYANMVWLWKNKWFISDWITFSDENIDNVIDFTTTLAIWAITMWAWMIVSAWARAVLTSARAINIWNKIAKTVKITNYLEKWTKSAKILSFIWNATLEWVAFYEWATIMQNLMFKDLEDWNKWLLDWHEIVKSIAFMWALNSLKFFSKIPWMWKIQNFSDKIWKKYIKKENILKILKWTWNVVMQWSSMFAISGLIDTLSWEWWDPTVEEYLQFIALIQVMKLKDMWRH